MLCSFKLRSNGRTELGVHIADVSYFVRQGGLLDSEARDRCTSVYLVDRWAARCCVRMRMCLCLMCRRYGSK